MKSVYILVLSLISLVQGSFFTFHSLNYSRIVVIADIHADISRFKHILRDANIIDTSNKWIAESNSIVIQLGDQIDPKEPDSNDIDDTHHFKMIHFTEKLRKDALNNNCSFISLIGNHELYNIDKIKSKDDLKKIIASRPIVVKIGRYIFCHGGFKKVHYLQLDIYNKTFSDLNEVWDKYVNDVKLSQIDTVILRDLILDRQNSILFTRETDDKKDIDILTELLGIDYILVGHTTFDSITLKNKEWYLDLYLKTAFDTMSYNYIVIQDSNIMIKQLKEYPIKPPFLDFIYQIS